MMLLYRLKAEKIHFRSIIIKDDFFPLIFGWNYNLVCSTEKMDWVEQKSQACM